MGGGGFECWLQNRQYLLLTFSKAHPLIVMPEPIRHPESLLQQDGIPAFVGMTGDRQL